VVKYTSDLKKIYSPLWINEMNGVVEMLSIFQNKYIVVDYANIVQEEVTSTLNKGYNIGFTSDEVIAYATLEHGEIYMVFMSEDGASFSKHHYTERLINGLYKSMNLKQ
jgi:hypothetical protein